MLIILQWNARRLIANGQELKQYIQELSVKPNIICIQESWLKPSLDFTLYGYTAVRKDRTIATGGGVVTFIQHGVNYRAINSSEELEIIIIETWINKTKIRIINLYNPCQKITRDTLERVCGVEKSKIIICGDFNAHNTLWGSARTDGNGYIIEEFMDDNQLVYMNGIPGMMQLVV